MRNNFKTQALANPGIYFAPVRPFERAVLAHGNQNGQGLIYANVPRMSRNAVTNETPKSHVGYILDNF